MRLYRSYVTTSLVLELEIIEKFPKGSDRERGPYIIRRDPPVCVTLGMGLI